MKNESKKIKFGTDGWRAVIADEFTYHNVKRVARAIGLYAVKLKKTKPLITVGYDTRFNSKPFAETIAGELANCGCNVLLSDTFISTPVLSSSVIDNNAFGGVMVSASHNPPEFNGIKFKTNKGSSASELITKQFEKFLISDTFSLKKTGKIQNKNFLEPYFKRILSFVDFKAIKNANLNIIVDPMYGAGIDYIQKLLQNSKNNVINIHSYSDPLFGGLHPEPIEKNLADLKKTVILNKADVGLATDGDADRIGVVAENGRYLTPHQVFPLILYYLCKYKGLRGKVIQSISLGYVSERIANDYNLECEEVSVGFKYIAERIMNEKILIGGEESGGYGYGAYIPERDGILNSMIIIEMLAVTGKKISELLAEIEKKYGMSCYVRTDFKNIDISKVKFVEKLTKNVPKKIAGLTIKKVKNYDGIEYIFDDDSWLLLRPSGTEPVVRVYSESDSISKTNRIISCGEKIVKAIL